jgi:hypothetical protein
MHKSRLLQRTHDKLLLFINKSTSISLSLAAHRIVVTLARHALEQHSVINSSGHESFVAVIFADFVYAPHSWKTVERNLSQQRHVT